MKIRALGLFLFSIVASCSDAKLPDSSSYTFSPAEGAQHLQNATDVDSDELDVEALRKTMSENSTAQSGVSIPINNYGEGHPIAAGGCPWAQASHKGTLPGLPAGLEVTGAYLQQHGFFSGNNFIYSIPVVHNATTLQAGDAQLGTGQIGNYVSNVTGLIENFNLATCAPSAVSYRATNEGTAAKGGIARMTSVSKPKKRTNGCFAASSQIHLADGSKKFMLHLNMGDVVLNPVTQKPAKIAEIVAGPEELALYEIGIGTNVVRVTSLHPFLTDNGLRQAKDLKVGDRILSSSNRFEPLTKARSVPGSENQVVYNVTLETSSDDFTNHALLVDGVVSGDLHVQQKLSLEIQNQSQIPQAVAGFFSKLVSAFTQLFAT